MKYLLKLAELCDWNLQISPLDNERFFLSHHQKQGTEVWTTSIKNPGKTIRKAISYILENKLRDARLENPGAVEVKEFCGMHKKRGPMYVVRGFDGGGYCVYTIPHPRNYTKLVSMAPNPREDAPESKNGEK